MKKIILYVVLCTLSPIFLAAQEMKAVIVESNKIVNLNADEAWQVVNNWANLHKLVPEIVESTTVNNIGLGSTWQIYLRNGKRITEKMVYYNSNHKTMSYIMTETPLPIQDYTAIIMVEPYGISKSLVSFYTSCITSNSNFENIFGTFESFQETYLSNIQNQENE